MLLRVNCRYKCVRKAQWGSTTVWNKVCYVALSVKSICFSCILKWIDLGVEYNIWNDTINQSISICKRNKISNTKGYKTYLIQDGCSRSPLSFSMTLVSTIHPQQQRTKKA